jgi:exopolysaccharide production protein ExoY
MTDFAPSGISPFGLSQPRPVPIGGRAKRITDVTVSVCFFILFTPLLLLTAVAIKLLDGGPVLYAHRRIGFDRKQFHCWKFRTMVPQADRLLAAHLASDQKRRAEWSRFCKLKDDPRVTRLGKVLRETSLDELPQLLNVIKGDMSLVGPRPVLANEAIKYGWRIQKYAAARPGMTGLWQVSGRSKLSYRRRVASDAVYVDHYSYGRDLIILLRTIHTVISKNGSC